MNHIYFIILIIFLFILLNLYENYDTCRIINCDTDYTINSNISNNKCCIKKAKAISYQSNCNINECDIGYSRSNDASTCCIKNNDNSLVYDNNCKIALCNSGYIKSSNTDNCCFKDSTVSSYMNTTCDIKDCISTHVKSVNGIKCCPYKDGALSYNDNDCTIKVYIDQTLDFFKVFGKINQDDFITYTSYYNGTIITVDRDIKSFENMSKEKADLIGIKSDNTRVRFLASSYYNNTIYGYGIIYKNDNINVPGIKNFFAVSYKNVNIYTDDNRLYLKEVINWETLFYQGWSVIQVKDYIVKKIDIPRLTAINVYTKEEDYNSINFTSYFSNNTSTSAEFTYETLTFTNLNNIPFYIKAMNYSDNNINIYLDISFKKLVKSLIVSDLKDGETRQY
jgi:hypothetical protein